MGVADKDYDAKLEEAEKKKVAEIEKSLTDEQKDEIVKEAVALRASQDGDQNADILPTLKVSEAVPRRSSAGTRS